MMLTSTLTPTPLQRTNSTAKRSRPRSQPLSDLPFIVGSERSGTTLLRLMLDHHPQLSFASEFEFAVQRVAPDGTYPSIDEYCEWLSTNRIFTSSGFTIDPDLGYRELIESFLRQKRDAADKPYVGATVHFCFDRLLHLWPDARFIHIVRDGRDVARSCIEMGWAGNPWAGAKKWIEAEQLWERVSASLPAHQQLTITYESLVRDPRATLSRVCEFIGVSFDNAMLEYPKDSTYGAPDPRFLDQWRRRMDTRDVQLVESRIGEMLVERGYELSGLARIEVTPRMERTLRRNDRIGRARFRRKRYGTMLYLSDLVSRRIGARGWQKRVKLRINAEDLKYLK